MNAEAKKCPECGTILNAEGLCPACLLNVGMATRSAEIVTGGTGKPPAVRPEAGKMFGQYRIARLLGRGGMGEVYEAEDTTTGRRVAVKVLNQAITSDADRKRFIREGRMAATVSDPHVVYVYGSEEIGGAPVIAMELADGGTLKDRIKKGDPLPPSEAVDDILQVIDGLESAAKAGVLHRDIKPANCFVDRDGNVKVGDFGLSISTLGHMESQNLTAPGSLLGTPAFASPEQLRGSQLDVRSDIYSVGATLFFLLTGKPPFEADAIVALISAVLDKAPPSPRTLRPNISQGLANVVLKCLAKDPKERFTNYEDLRHALQPFCSTARKPATLGLRFVAGFVDSFFAVLPGIIFSMIGGHDLVHRWMADRSFELFTLWSATAVWTLLYYSFPESRWGATFGKWLCGLRVVGPDRLPPAFSRALLRAFIYVFITHWAEYIIQFFANSTEEMKLMVQGALMNFSEFSGLILWAAIFISIRRRNGYAGLHELATKTRVVTKEWRRQTRPALGSAALVPPQMPDTATGASPIHFVGPYVVLDDSRDSVVLARDEVLRRNVWIVNQPAGAPPLAPLRRDLARPGRLRWLNGMRSPTEAWDAFEAPEGKRLLELPAATRNWDAVRFWLLDLAQEISAGMKDASLAPLTVENVFITAQGRAVLLDVGMPASAGTAIAKADTIPSNGRTPTLPDVQKFLSDVVEGALGAEPHGLPLEVPPFLNNLRERSLHAMEFVIANLTSFTEKLPEVTRRRRMGSMFLAPACFAMMGVMVTVGTYYHSTGTTTLTMADDDGVNITEMSTVFTTYAMAGTNDLGGMRDAAGMIIARRYAKQANDPKFWQDNPTFLYMSTSLHLDMRGEAQAAVKRYASATDEDLKKADEKMLLSYQQANETRRKMMPYIGVMTFFGGLMLLGTFNLVCSIIGMTPGLRLFGMAVVNRHGKKSSRWRLVVRSLVAWFPFLLLPFIMPLAGKFHVDAYIACSLLGLPWVVGIVLTIRRPSRGLHDRAAGTWLVPR